MDAGLASGNPFAVLTAVVAPAILTNACSVLALGTSNRLARVVDRTRVVARMVSSAETEAASDETAAQRHSAELRSQGWAAQLAGLQVRTQLLVKALRAIYGSLGLFAMAALVSVAVVGLATGCALMVQETRLAVRNLTEEAKMYTARKFAETGVEKT